MIGRQPDCWLFFKKARRYTGDRKHDKAVSLFYLFSLMFWGGQTVASGVIRL
jgi:hypothetical protein